MPRNAPATFFLVLGAVAAACGGRGDSSPPPPLPGEVVLALGGFGYVNGIAGGPDGVALAAGDGLHVLRSSGVRSIEGDDYWACSEDA